MRNFKKMASLIIAGSLLCGTLSAVGAVEANAAEIEYIKSQTQNQSHMYSKDFTLTGNYADDLVAVGQAQMGKTKAELEYYESWCADFVNDCARLTNMPESIIPYNYGLRASCAYLYRYMIDNCGAKIIEDTNDLRTGDLVFYYCPASNFYLHVGMIESPSYYIEGNYQKKVQHLDFNYNYSCYMHKGGSFTSDSGHVKRIYVRPNYPEPPKKGYTETSPDSENYFAPTRTLTYKTGVFTSGFDVSWTQAVLFNLGYNIDVTGEYSSKTVDAVKKFQLDNQLTPTGDTDSETAALLEELWHNKKYPRVDNYKSAKDIYNYNENVCISADITNADSVKLVIENGLQTVKTIEDSSNVSFPAKEIGQGYYTAYFVMKNVYSTFTTEPIDFIVDKPMVSAPNIAALSGTTYKAASIKWDKTLNTDHYEVYITNTANSAEVISEKYVKNNSFSALLPVGEYKVRVVSVNDFSTAESNTADFKVVEGKPQSFGDEFYARLPLTFDQSLSLALSDKTAALGTSSNSFSQTWYFKKHSNNSYYIKNCENGKQLAIGSQGAVIFDSESDTSLQRWYLAQSGENSFWLVPAFSASNVLKAGQNSISVGHSTNNETEAFTLKKVSHEHNYDISEFKAPTCTHNGHITYRCKLCGEEDSKTIRCEGHTSEKEKTSAPNAALICDKCGEAYIKGNAKATVSDTPDSPSSKSGENTSITVIMGDVDRDGELTSNDALIVTRLTVGLEQSNDFKNILADVDIDGTATVSDSLAILRTVVGLKTETKTGFLLESGA